MPVSVLPFNRASSCILAYQNVVFTYFSCSHTVSFSSVVVSYAFISMLLVFSMIIVARAGIHSSALLMVMVAGEIVTCYFVYKSS
ncbi:hypothetical protein F5050DRAFT_1700303 [Lentinula boryana]|uniref:Uncharacterized protein n=1 Tax=Lentinula boryana TaxID=40481 RepID=A0ABQ8PZA0_9AGAR|nr:hypothetical protein F5050DRAFT_1700303 [Lentinula boryana]